MDETITAGAPDDGRPKLARRNDDVGRLAWRLVGDEKVPPDPSAAPLLFDALEDSDFPRTAIYRLRDELIRHALGFEFVENRPASARNAVSHWQEEMTRIMTPFLWDIDSALALTAWAVERCRSAPPPVEAGKVEVNVVWADVGPAGLGETVRLDDGRRGTVVMEARPDGRSGVALRNETGEGGAPVPAFSSGPRRRW